ncbi:hypothetical protein PMAYCL1PPCAC_30378, partial [Pristionchus mayeri]
FLPLFLLSLVHSQGQIHHERTNEYTRKVISDLFKERSRSNRIKYGPIQYRTHREENEDTCSSYCNGK